MVALLLVSAIVDMQERLLKQSNLSHEQYELIDIGDRVIFAAGFGPEDWGEFELVDGPLVDGMKMADQVVRMSSPRRSVWERLLEA